MRCLLILLLLSVPLFASLDHARAIQQTIDSRAPFAIELPEINTGLLNAATTTDVLIPPGKTITRIRLWVLNPYAGRVGYRINAALYNQSREGKALGIVGQKGSGKYGNYFEVDLRQNPDIRLSDGKNVIEVMAEEREANTTYRCSFVLLPGVNQTAKPACDPSTVPIDPKCAAAVRSAEFGGRKFALLVGVSKYRHHEGGLGDLEFADADAMAVRDWLRTAGGGNFREEDIECLTNDGATSAAVESAVGRFLTKAGENDLIFLFLAGHGAPDPYDPRRLYFLLHDSKVTDLPRTAFLMSKLGEFLERQSKQVRLIAFLDTCHSAGIKAPATNTELPGKMLPQKARGVGVKKAGAAGTRTSLEAASAKQTSAPAAASDFNFYDTELFKQKGWTIIASSGMKEFSQEGTQWGNGHGVFTWALLEGARGKADLNGDCRITAAELTQYITSTVSRETGKEQTPQSLPGSSRDLVVAVVQDSAACRGVRRK